MFRTLLLLATFASLSPAATEWSYGSSDHFEVYTTGGAGRAREALNYFERIHAFFSEVLKVDPQLKAPTRLIIFSSEKEYAPFRINEGAFAYYQAGPDRDYIVMRSLSSETYPVVVHEYMHLVARHLNASALPVWLNEGWADFYSTVQNTGGKMSVGAIPPGRMYQASQSKPMPLEKLFAVGHDSPEYNNKELMGPFYAQSWALTHMLLADSNYYKQSPKFLELMLGGADSAKAITGAYGRTLAQITKDLEAYIRTGQFILRLFDYKDPKARKDLETREATPFEAALVTANMQAISLRSQAEARAAFSKLEQENEAHLELQESIAAFEYRHGHRDDAMAHYARASALGSTNWQLYRDYGFLTTDMDLRTELFGKALNLNPNDLDLRIRYSDGLLRAGKHFQALAALVPVRKVDPKQAFMFFQLSARANAAAQQMDEARRAAGRAVEFASTPVEKDYATRLAKSLETPSSRPTSTQVSANTLDVADIAGVVDLDGSGSGRPRLVRRNDGTTADINALSLEEIRAINNESLVNGAKTVTAARFQALDCSGAQPIMIFAGEGGALRLSMKDPSTILLRGTGAATVSLSCGDQNDRRVRVGYNPEADPKTRTAGDVRFLEFQ